MKKQTLTRSLINLLLAAMAASVTFSVAAQQDFSKVEIKTQEISPGIYMLEGAGGNLGLSAGEDGSFLIDDQYAPLTEKIKAAVAKVTPKPVRFLVNTHWHGDHTGGNENLGKDGVVIVAHDNVRARMAVDTALKAFGTTVPAAPHIALPVITFADGVTFHVNGDEVLVHHVAPAHTDGDSIVHFKKANVIHTGDIFFNGLYPFIDVDNGGGIDGMIAGAKVVLAMADDKTKIIPGHGPLAGKAELATYIGVLEKIRANVAALIAAGKSKEEAVAAKPTAEFDEIWGKAFMKPDTFAGIVYSSLKH